jgi:hypothetical protein
MMMTIIIIIIIIRHECKRGTVYRRGSAEMGKVKGKKTEG